jgi:hypothetical protein
MSLLSNGRGLLVRRPLSDRRHRHTELGSVSRTGSALFGSDDLVGYRSLATVSSEQV